MSHLDDVKRWKARKKLKGLCPNCGKKKQGTFYYCNFCKKKHNEALKARNKLKREEKEFW